MNEQELSTLTLRELFTEHERVWGLFVGTPLEEQRKCSDNGYEGDSESCVLYRELRTINLEIEKRPQRDLEADIREVLGDAIKGGSLSVQVYAALCNVDWENEDGSRYSCSWRYAGGFVNEIVNPGDKDPMGYCNFYCSGGEGYVDPAVAGPLAALGWSHRGDE